VTHLLVKPRELDGGNFPGEFGDGPADVRRQRVVGRQQRHEIWDNTDLARLSDPSEACEPTVLAAYAVHQRSLLE
jgi:hypothetical protein